MKELEIDNFVNETEKLDFNSDTKAIFFCFHSAQSEITLFQSKKEVH